MKLMLMLKLMVNGQPNVDVNMSDLCLLIDLTRVGPFKGPVPIQYLFTFILLLWRAIQNFMFTFSFFNENGKRLCFHSLQISINTWFLPEIVES